MINANRLRVIIIAHELSPIQGSECAVGWNVVTRLAKYHDVTVLYASAIQLGENSYVNAVSNYFQKNDLIPGLTLINIDNPRPSKYISLINKLFLSISPVGLPMLYYLGYKFWHKAAFNKAKKLHNKNNFDIAHQLTQITFREPGYLYKLKIPFVWGPTGGIPSIPFAFINSLSTKPYLIEKLRTFFNKVQFKYSSRIKKANMRADLIYTFSKEDAGLLLKRAVGQIKLMLDVGTYYNKSVFAKSNNNKPARLKGVWCGRLTELKAPQILLQALAKDIVTREEIEFQIIGSGTLELKLKKMVKELGLNNIEFINRVSHEEVFKIMGDADFFVHTSLREATSSVIPEALSMGLPVICHDANGMGLAVNSTCGIKIPRVSPETSINGFHNAIKKICLERDLLETLKKGAFKRSQEISWDIMVATLADDYNTIINKQ